MKDRVNRFIGTDGRGTSGRLSGFPPAAMPAQDVGRKLVCARIVLVEKLRRKQQRLAPSGARFAPRFLNIVEISARVSLQAVKDDNRACDAGLRCAQISFRIEGKLPAAIVHGDSQAAAGNSFDGIALREREWGTQCREERHQSKGTHSTIIRRPQTRLGGHTFLN